MDDRRHVNLIDYVISTFVDVHTDKLSSSKFSIHIFQILSLSTIVSFDYSANSLSFCRQACIKEKIKIHYTSGRHGIHRTNIKSGASIKLIDKDTMTR